MRRISTVPAVWAFLMLLIQFAATAEAQVTFLVDSTADTPTAGTCLDGTPNDCTLREAIMAANALPGGDAVTFHPAVFPATITLVAPTSPIIITESVSIDGGFGLTGPTTISGGGVTGIFSIGAPGLSVQFFDLILTNGAMPGGAGGALFLGDGFFTVHNTTISNSSADDGGGIFFVDTVGTSTLIVTSSTFSGNGAAAEGGAIVNYDGTLIVANSTFSGNSAADGGALISLADTRNPSVEIYNSTFSGNSATGVGGGVAANRDVATLTGTFAVVNTIIANSTAGNNCAADDTAISGANSLEDGTTCGWGLGNITGTDPLLGPLGSYGGATDTFPLLPGSLAIDAGDPGTCTGAAAGVDQRGIARPTTPPDACDIGAFESQGFTLSMDSGSGQTASVGTAFPNPLVVGVAANVAPEPVDGGMVNYRVLTGGAGLTFGSLTTQSIAGMGGSGTASLGVTANDTVGTFDVNFDTTGAPTSPGHVFQLENTPAVTTTTITADTPDPSYPGESVSVTVAVTGLNPSGTVDITGADTNCSLALAGGTGSCDVVFTGSGPRTLTATYNGDGVNTGSGDTESHEVFFPPGDVDHDGSADMFWRNPHSAATGATYFNGTTYSGRRKFFETGHVPPVMWIMAAAADFDLDGHTDILWRNEMSGVNIIAYYRGTQLVGHMIIDALPVEWSAFGTGDVNRDRYPEIFWFNTRTKENRAWDLVGNTSLVLPSAFGPWVPVAVGNLDNDTSPDIVAQNNVTGHVVAALLNGTNIRKTRIVSIASTGWQNCGTMDMTGDNLPDIVWRDPVTGSNEVWGIRDGALVNTIALPSIPPPWKCMAGHK